MPEDYRALAAAIRRPMRQWWLRVGITWGILLLAPLGLSLYYTIVIGPQGASGAIPVQQSIRFSNYNGLVDLLLYPGARLLWLLAALRANSLLTGLLKDSSLGGDNKQFSSMRFALAMAQGVVPFCASLAYYAVTDAVAWYCLPSYGVARQSLWYAGSQTIIGLLEFLAGMIWYMAFLAIVHLRPKFLWIWFCLANVLPPLAGSAYSFLAATGIYIIHSTGSIQSQDSSYNTFTAWSIGLVIMLFLLDSFYNRRKYLAWFSYGLLTLMVLIGANGLLYQVLQNTLSSSSAWQVSVTSIAAWNRIFAYLPAWATPLHATSDVVFTGAKVWAFSPALVLAQGHEALVLLAVVINVAWLALLYAFIRFIVLRSPQRPESTSDAKP